MNVAVLDIGSNSIKVLVATRHADGRLEALLLHTIDARISAGISKAHPRLGEEGMARGLAAIEDLLARAAAFQPAKVELVATSAVRDAENGHAFRERVAQATGHWIRILSGDEEATLIGRGLTCDPALAGQQDFYVFDLGGGSLECLAFRNRTVVGAASLPLGCVRLTERFIADPTAPIGAADRHALATHVERALHNGPFRFALPREAAAVFAGGSMTTIRALLGAREGRRMQDAPSFIPRATVQDLLERVVALPLAERKRIPGMPEARADVFPAALITIDAIARHGGFPGFQHSLYNLRWGLADAALSA